MYQRSEREKQSVDRSDIYQNSEKLHQSFAHVFGCPNTLRYEKLLQEKIALLVSGKKVLDKGIFIINK